MCRCSAHTTTRDVCCGVRLGSTLSPYPPTQSTTFVGFRVFIEIIKTCGRYMSLILKGAAHWAQFLERESRVRQAGQGQTGILGVTGGPVTVTGVGGDCLDLGAQAGQSLTSLGRPLQGRVPRLEV